MRRGTACHLQTFLKSLWTALKTDNFNTIYSIVKGNLQDRFGLLLYVLMVLSFTCIQDVLNQHLPASKENEIINQSVLRNAVLYLFSPSYCNLIVVSVNCVCISRICIFPLSCGYYTAVP